MKAPRKGPRAEVHYTRGSVKAPPTAQIVTPCRACRGRTLLAVVVPEMGRDAEPCGECGGEELVKATLTGVEAIRAAIKAGATSIDAELRSIGLTLEADALRSGEHGAARAAWLALCVAFRVLYTHDVRHRGVDHLTTLVYELVKKDEPLGYPVPRADRAA